MMSIKKLIKRFKVKIKVELNYLLNLLNLLKFFNIHFKIILCTLTHKKLKYDLSETNINEIQY